MTALPAMLRELAEIVGEAGAIEIARAYGGRILYVPRRMGPEHPIAMRVGLDNARALCALYGSEKITLPLGPTGSLAAARRVLAEALERGATANEAAAASGLTTRTVHNLRRARRERRDSRQGDFFD